MSKRFLAVLSAVVILTAATRLLAQPTTSQQTGQTTNTTAQQPVSLDDELRNARDENKALKNILASIQSIDTARQSELIQFIITDRSIRSRVISAFRKAGYNISPNTNGDLIATQKPGTREDLINGDYNTDLLRIIIDQVGVYGGPTIRRILGEDLYNKINSRSDYEYTMLSSPSPQQRIQYALINASLFGGSIIFKSGFGFGMTVGNDFIGLPFWQAGNVGVEGIIHKEMTDVQLGLNFQMGDAGITPFTINGGFNIKNRKLEGTQGFHASLEQAVDVIDKSSGRLSFGGEFFEAFPPSITTFSSRAADDDIYRTDYPKVGPNGAKDSLFYVGLSAHAWVTYSFAGALKGAYIRLGAGTHRVNAATIGEKNTGTGFGATNDPTVAGYSDVVVAKNFDEFDPVAKIGYNHPGTDGNDWGISVQYSSQLLADGYIQIFNWLDIEAKYATVVGRDPEKWEWQDFVMISPVLHLNF